MRMASSSIAGAVEGVLHALHFVEIPAAVRGALLHLHGEVADAVAQVVVQVFLGGDIAAGDGMVVAADVHQGVSAGPRGGGGAGRQSGQRPGEISASDHPYIKAPSTRRFNLGAALTEWEPDMGFPEPTRR